MTLNSFLIDLREKPFVWGQTDCALILADWAMEKLDCPDPASHLRDAYETQLECARVIQRAGGLLPLVNGICEYLDLHPAENPKRGDIGIVGDENRIHRQWGGIYTGEFWMIKAGDGLVALRSRPIAAWRLQTCQQQ